MDLNVICKSILEIKDKEAKIELLGDMKTTIEKQGLIYHDIKKLFKSLETIILSKETAVITGLL